MEFPSWTELVESNVARHGDLVAGIDPSLPDLPAFFGQDSAWIGRFVDFMIEAIEGRVGFVKFQSAYFEACGLTGLKALAAGMQKARAAGIGVILDAKRGDIGATASAFACCAASATASRRCGSSRCRAMPSPKSRSRSGRARRFELVAPPIQLSSPGLTGRPSIPETPAIEPRSRSVLDPRMRGDDNTFWNEESGARNRHHAGMARLPR